MAKKALLVIAVLLGLPLAYGQQPSTPQPTQAQPAPCSNGKSPLPKGVKVHPPSALQKIWDKERAQISQKAGIDLPSAQEIINDATAPKPCQAPQIVPVPAAVAPIAPLPPPPPLSN